MEAVLRRSLRLYTHWRRPSRDRNRRLVVIAVMLALTGLAIALFGSDTQGTWPGGWP